MNTWELSHAAVRESIILSSMTCPGPFLAQSQALEAKALNPKPGDLVGR